MKLANTIIITQLILLISPASAKQIQISTDDKYFIHVGGMNMVKFNNMYDYCLINVLPENEKMFKNKREWVDKYWPTTLELVHYSSKVYSEASAKFKNINIDEVDILAIQNRIYASSEKKAVEVFDGKEKGEQKRLCKKLGEFSLIASAEIVSRYKTLKSTLLVKKYGEYDGDAVNQSILDSLKSN